MLFGILLNLKVVAEENASLLIDVWEEQAARRAEEQFKKKQKAILEVRFLLTKNKVN